MKSQPPSLLWLLLFLLLYLSSAQRDPCDGCMDRYNCPVGC